MPSAKRRRVIVPALLTFVAAIVALPVLSQERLAFIGVALDSETRQADAKLQDYLERRADVSFSPQEHEYERAIGSLASWNNAEGLFLARTTPYVYVAAEMLGADLEVLASYVSATTRSRTYNSYFVVNRDDFATQPSLDEVIRYLADRQDRARFIYHNQFSTSSYFLPSLLFRSRKIFNMPESTESLIAIESRKIAENSSTSLVRAVAAGEADLAAVWDGTKAKFEEGHPSGLFATVGRHVFFVKLPTTLPNDLLVCSASLPGAVKELLRAALGAMTEDEIATGDFLTWQDVKEATDVRLALAGLRWSARERVAAVTIDSRLAPGTENDPSASALGDAVRQAIRFSGTEFVLFDEDFHEHIDFVWTIETTHDGAVVLHSSIPGTGIEEQRFQISFRDLEDFTQRVVSIIQSRIHRVRYVWPYSSSPPIVIRDLALSIPVDTRVKVQRISWLDPEKNSFRGGALFDARIHSSGFYTYRLEADDFPPIDELASDFDAMSNVSYRVFLTRVSEEREIFRILTWVLIGLLVIAAVAAVVSLRGASSVVGNASPARDPSSVGSSSGWSSHG
ncbi:MAG: PhnD/SsuA/transferrin family substrate-binding protein [bacterium]|nr:PhnD/SsuA/transferrin family substrate-binding protein [bacterium]